MVKEGKAKVRVGQKASAGLSIALCIISTVNHSLYQLEPHWRLYRLLSSFPKDHHRHPLASLCVHPTPNTLRLRLSHLIPVRLHLSPVTATLENPHLKDSN